MACESEENNEKDEQRHVNYTAWVGLKKTMKIKG